MDNRKENEVKQQARVRKQTMPIPYPPKTASCSASVSLASQKKRSAADRLHFCYLYQRRHQSKCVHDTTDILDKMKGRSPLRSQAER